jgi:hypothetical protein
MLSTTSAAWREIAASPDVRRCVTCSALRSAIERWLNQVAAATASATTTEVVKMSLAEIEIPVRALAEAATRIELMTLDAA